MTTRERLDRYLVELDRCPYAIHACGRALILQVRAGEEAALAAVARDLRQWLDEHDLGAVWEGLPGIPGLKHEVKQQRAALAALRHPPPRRGAGQQVRLLAQSAGDERRSLQPATSR